MNNEAEEYLKVICLEFPGEDQNRKRLLRDMEDALCCFTEENPECSTRELYEHFGSPTEFVRVYCENAGIDVDHRENAGRDLDAGTKEISKSKQFMIALVACAVAVVLLFTGFLTYATIQYKNSAIAGIVDDIEYNRQEEKIK